MRIWGPSREHAESDLRGFLTWCAEHGQDPLTARLPHLELYIRWMQEIRRFKPSTVSRRFSVVAGFYRTCVIDDLLEHSPAEHVRRPSVPPESPTLGFKHLQFEALLTAARESLNTSTSRSSLLRAGQTLLSLSAHGARQERKPEESHTKDTDGQPQDTSVPPGTWTEPGPTPVLTPVLSSRWAGYARRPQQFYYCDDGMAARMATS